MFLYEHNVKKEIELMKVQAMLHGIDIKTQGSKVLEKPKEQNLLFGDPKEYEKMSQVEREELTKKMMVHYTPLTQQNPVALISKRG